MASTEIERIRAIVQPIVDDLHLDLYDVERRGDTIQITVDTPPGSDGGVDLDTIALASRLIGREFDHDDPVAGRYRLDVSSPGLERRMRTPEHFRREVGKDVTVRLAGHAVTEGGERRLDGRLVAADDTTITLLSAAGDERSIEIASIDKARTVFEWGPKPKPGKGPKSGKSSKQSGSKQAVKEKS